jgi:hypothetical protein
MEYVIECRFSDAFSSSPPIRELIPDAREIVLFLVRIFARRSY